MKQEVKSTTLCLALGELCQTTHAFYYTATGRSKIRAKHHVARKFIGKIP
jgi:hypothetical protein